MSGFSFYGKHRPRVLVAVAWLLVFASVLLLMLSPGMPGTYLAFSVAAGLVVIALAVKLKSILLLVAGSCVAVSYYGMALMMMSVTP
ncbi:hypothetical protein ACFSSC_05220 [Corynebacterium mendelii]|uniref:Uncharacterized protein n=1 Tax=Corynebacterium mendelii TaxID=2765362 RepID=A0A939DZY1_9CORY|nr:hypothetical protein [Corynebacterium mendelii]MBN9643201.1 hypothetical protein [Corynebacterium mendelii]